MARKDPGTLGVNLASRIAAIMTKTRVDSTAQLIPPMQKAIVDSLTLAMGRVKIGDSDSLREFLREHYGHSPLTPETERLLDDFEGLNDFASGILLLMGILLSIVPILQAAAIPMMQREEYAAWSSQPLMRLDVGTVASASMRGLMGSDEAVDEASQSGFGQQRLSILQELARLIPPTDQLWAMRNRGDIDDADLQTYLERSGYISGDAARLGRLRLVLPGAQDVVRFAVRDVYRPEAVSRGGLLQDLPPAGVEDAERVGLTPEEFTKYWAAHWVLPSIGQAFDMLHRGVIDLQELKDLLRTQDVAPGWRDELIEIAYSVISRVDIRRMYREGVASEDKVLETYLAQGYKEGDAELLTEFAIADATVDARELTKGEVIRLYQDGAMTRDDASGLLVDLGFQGPETEWLLVLAEFRRFAKFRELAVSRVRSRYVGRRLSESEASGALDAIGVVSEERDILIDLWDAERDAERPVLTSAMIGGLYRRGVIGEEEARVRWGELGFRSGDIDLLVLNYSDGDPESRGDVAKSKQLTKSDIGRALKEDTITVDEAVTAWIAMGYSEGAAFLLARNYLPEEDT